MKPEDLPYKARELSLRERRTLDTYEFVSPKNRRLVTIVEPSRLALALELEFDPWIVDYVERPRGLRVGEKSIELCFWHRSISGIEQYELLTTNKEPTVHAARHAERRTAQILEAAKLAGTNLRVRRSSYCLVNRIPNSTRLLLLPYVQAAMSLPNSHVLEQAIKEHVEAIPRTTFYAIERSLPAFRGHELRAQVCALIHRGYLAIDPTIRLRLGNAVWRRETPP